MNESASLELIILGSGSAVQFQQRCSASYLLKIGNKNLLLDAGFYLLERLEQMSVSADKIDYIFISHKHPDHFMGLIHLLFALKNPVYNRREPLIIFGFKGLSDYFRQFRNILGKWIEPDFEVIIIEKEAMKFTEFSYKLFDTAHSEESVGIQIHINNKKIVYTSDTEFFPELIDIVDHSSITIFECATNEAEQIAGHLTVDDILKISKKSNIDKIILSHFYPNSLPSINLPENFLIAEDLLSVKICHPPKFYQE